MNYAITVLNEALRDIQKTKDVINAKSFPFRPNDEMVKIEFQELQIKSLISIAENNTHISKTTMYKTLSKEYGKQYGEIKKIIESNDY